MVLPSIDIFEVQKQPIGLWKVLVWLWFEYSYVTFIGFMISLHVANGEHFLSRHFLHFASTIIAGFLLSLWLITNSKGQSPIS